jgi:transposase
MMVALLMYVYARGNRSSRGLERVCVEDVAYRVMVANLVPDHSTIAEFRCRHEHALGEVFAGVLGLGARVGLASVGVVSIDGTKVSANASINANRDFTQIARHLAGGGRDRCA